MALSLILGAINVVVSIMSLRTQGGGALRTPLAAWAWLITGYVLIATMSALAGAQTLLLWDDFFGTTFFTASFGGDSLMFHHSFWLVESPAMCIQVVLGFSVVAELIKACLGPPSSHRCCLCCWPSWSA
jgi:cytochrome c oxidase subunit 1